MKKSTTTLARRTDTDERAERILAEALRGRGGAITRADAVALTGLSVDETEQALKGLLGRYKSHLAVTEAGELVYKFDPAMVRRDAVTLGERLTQLAAAAWLGFTFLFKIWIVTTLVVYVLAFVAMMIALVFAQSAGDRDDRDNRGGGLGMNPWLLYWLMPDWAPAGYYNRGYGSRGYALAGRSRPKKRFYQSVFDYVFGPRAAPVDPLAGEKGVVAYLRDHGGRITTTDLVALTGWSYERADEEATRLLASYDGEPEVKEDGSIVYAFPSLRRTAGELGPGAGTWRYAWRTPRQLPPFSGNGSGTDTAITVMNGFNLVAALTIGPAFLARFGIDGDAARALVTAVPLAFSSVFYAVPLGRRLRRGRAEKRLAREAARAALVAEIFERRGAAARPEDILAAAATRGAAPEHLGPALERLLVELDGDVKTNAAGEPVYVFPRIAEERAAADAARRLAPVSETQAGQVVFSSDEDGTGEVPEVPSLATPRGPRLLS